MFFCLSTLITLDLADLIGEKPSAQASAVTAMNSTAIISWIYNVHDYLRVIRLNWLSFLIDNPPSRVRWLHMIYDFQNNFLVRSSSVRKPDGPFAALQTGCILQNFIRHSTFGWDLGFGTLLLVGIPNFWDRVCVCNGWTNLNSQLRTVHCAPPHRLLYVLSIELFGCNMQEVCRSSARHVSVLQN